MSLLKYLRHLIKVATKIFTSSYPYSKIFLFYTYFRLIAKSIAYYKISTSKNRHPVYAENLLGYRISFFTYSQIVNLFEEIFIYQVYKFKSPVNSPNIIDCGSNIGLSILYFKKLYPLANILSFEPDEATFSLLENNIKINNLQNISLVNIALSDKEEKAFLYKTSALPGSLNMSLVKSNRHPIKQTTSAKKLSDYINHPIHLIKVDVEGSEVKILNDFSTSEKKMVIHKMIVEYHPSITKIPISEFCTTIENLGVTCHCIKDSLHSGATEVMVQCDSYRNSHL